MLQSPPSRRRGLKLENGVYGQKYIESPPSRRRGLKYGINNRRNEPGRLSPPSRRRGLK